MIRLLMKQETFNRLVETLNGVSVYSAKRFDAAGEGYYMSEISINDFDDFESQQYAYQFAKSEIERGNDEVFISRLMFVDDEPLNVWFGASNEMFCDDWIKDNQEVAEAVGIFATKNWSSLTTASGRELTWVKNS